MEIKTSFPAKVVKEIAKNLPDNFVGFTVSLKGEANMQDFRSLEKEINKSRKSGDKIRFLINLNDDEITVRRK